MRQNLNTSHHTYAGGEGSTGLELNQSVELDQGLASSVTARKKMNRLRVSAKTVVASHRFSTPKKAEPTYLAKTKLINTI